MKEELIGYYLVRQDLKSLLGLQRKPLSVKEIAKLVDLKPTTVGHHLGFWGEADFVESYEKKSIAVGMPEFCVRAHTIVVQVQLGGLLETKA